MKVNVEWTPPMRFKGLAESQAEIMMESRQEGTVPAGPSPMETVLMALAGCSGIDVMEVLQKMRVNVTDLRIEVDADRAPDPPRVFTKIRLRYRASGQGLTREQIDRAVTLSLEKYCSVAAMLRHSADISYDIILDEI